MTLRSGDLQWESDLDSIRNSCDVFGNWQLACLSMNISAFKNHEDDAAIKINKSKEFWRNSGKERWKYMTILKQEFLMRDNSWNWSKLMGKGKNYGICWFCMVVGDQPKEECFKRRKGVWEWWNDLGWMLTKGQRCFEQRWRWARRGGGWWTRVVHGTRSSHHHQSAQTIRHTCPHVESDRYSEWNSIVRTLFVFICIRQCVTRHQQSPTRLLCGRLKISSPTR